MKKLNFVFGLLLALGTPVLAQETPKVEIFGGYSYLNSNDGDDLNGWTTSVNKNINRWFGIKAEFSGYYSSYTDLAGDKLSISNHMILAGGQFTYRKNDKIQPFAHLLAGTVLSRAKVESAAGSISASGSGLAIVTGGGVDYKIAKAIAIRLIQADFVFTRAEGFNSHAIRLSSGAVFRLGDQ